MKHFKFYGTRKTLCKFVAEISKTEKHCKILNKLLQIIMQIRLHFFHEVYNVVLLLSYLLLLLGHLLQWQAQVLVK